MQIFKLPEKYDIANGLDGLAALLDQLLLQAKQNPNTITPDHYILYQLGNQKSLIKVDMTTSPFHFMYDDLLGRPATNGVKETIGRFLWEKCGEKEFLKFFEDAFFDKNRHARFVRDTELGVHAGLLLARGLFGGKQPDQTPAKLDNTSKYTK